MSCDGARDMAASWQEIDRELRSIAKRQRVLDAEEAALLCVVVRREIWRELGCATVLEYLEMIFGYGPMADLRQALENGEVSYSALRELTRVATANTQREWLDAVRGKNVRQVEDLVRTHQKGERPHDPPNPDLKPRRIGFDVSTATEAVQRQARQSFSNACGRSIDDDEFVRAMAAALLEAGASEPDQGRAKYQIRATTCDTCAHVYFEGGGRKIAVAAADGARAECDAQRIGVDHKALHEGKLVLSGIAPKLTVRFVHEPTLHVGPPHVTARHVESTSEPSAYSLAVMKAEAKQAMRQMQFPAGVANRCVEAALASEPRPTNLEQLLRAALRHSR